MILPPSLRLLSRQDISGWLEGITVECHIQNGDIVKCNGELYKVDNVKQVNGREPELKMHSIRGKKHKVCYCMPVSYVEKVETKKD